MSFRGGGSRRRGPQSVSSAFPCRRIRGLEPLPHLVGDGCLPQYDRLSVAIIFAIICRHRGAQRGTFRHPQNLRKEFFAGRLTSQVGHCSFRHLHDTMILMPLSKRRTRPRCWTPVAVPKADDPSKRQPLIRVRGAALIYYTIIQHAIL